MSSTGKSKFMEPSQKARAALDKSYSELQRLTAIDRAVWSRYFRGVQSPTLRTMQEIANKLGLELHDTIAAFLEKVREHKKPSVQAGSGASVSGDGD